MKKTHQLPAMLAALICVLTASGCTGRQSSTAENSDTNITTEKEMTEDDDAVPSDNEPVQAEPLSAAVSDGLPELTDADMNTDWDEDAVEISFDGSKVTVSDADGVLTENGTVTITKGGDYVLSGASDNGRVIVDLADDSEKVHLVLNGITLTAKTGAPLTALQADKVIVTLADGSTNTLSDTADAAEESDVPTACIAANCDMTFNGMGVLNAEGKRKNGIHCSDDLKIAGGEITVTAAGHGLRGNDSVTVFGGTLDVTAGGDGIKSTETEKEGKGTVAVLAGNIVVTAEQDGLDAATALVVAAGVLDVTAGGGYENADPHTESFPGATGGFPERGDGRRGGFGRNGMQDGSETAPETELTAAMDTEKAQTAEQDSDTTVSRKALKAGTTLTISGGAVMADAAEDGLHADGDVIIADDSTMMVTIHAGDDGIHADGSVTVDGGNIGISYSYEGIEAQQITINGGNLRVMSDDDGINASDGSGGGMGFSRNGTGELYLNGGYLFVNAFGDGLDSNGNITMTGGTVIVCGPTDNGNGPLDCGDNNNQITVTGGTLLAMGSTGMAETPEENYLAAEINAESGTLICVTDESGKVLAAFTAQKEAKGIVVSADGMADGYQIYTGGEYTGERNDDGFGKGGDYKGGTLIASGSGGSFGFEGFGHGGFDGNPPSPPEGFDGTPPDLPEGFDGMQPPENGENGMPAAPPDNGSNFEGRLPGSYDENDPFGRGERRRERGSDTNSRAN